MHLYWAGSAADGSARGVADVEWLLTDIAEGRSSQHDTANPVTTWA
jgi:hypothetical protein